jgi:hypothetical protein
VEKQGRELLQFFDILTSQYPMFNPQVHTTFSAHTSYLNEEHCQAYHFTKDDLAEFSNKAHLLPGCQKGTRFVHDAQSGLASAAVVVEAKKTPFHMVGSVLDKALGMVRDLERPTNDDFNNLRSGLKGLYVETTHQTPSRNKQMFFIGDVRRENAHQIHFSDPNGQQISVADYFETKYQRLNAPQFPLVVARGSGKDGNLRFFPMEVLRVCPHQRVKCAQQNPQMVQQTIRKCAVPPLRLMDHIARTIDSIHLNQSSYMGQAGVEVSKAPLLVPSGRMNPPDILYANNRSLRVRTDNFTWNTGPHLFHTTSEIKKWAAIALIDHRADDWTKFIEQFIKACQERGMRIGYPDRRATYRATDVSDVINKFADEEFEFVLALHSDFDKVVHENLKLAERRYLVVTQAIRRMTMLNVVGKNQWQTMGNIVAKTNVKMGGTDYMLTDPGTRNYKLLGKGDLFIGIAVNHPFGGAGGAEPATTGQQEMFGDKRREASIPSVIGYSANVGFQNDFEFIGDFLFQQPEREVRSTLVPKIVQRCVEKFRAASKDKKTDPNRIIIYRSGYSEGYYSKILMFDIPLTKHALKEMNCRSPMTMIVVNKLQNVRFFRHDAQANDRAPDQNVVPGSVVDSGVVHPLYQEFFLLSHRALQGTARAPKYTVLIDETGFDISELEHMSYQLCYGHQIVNMPTSMPSPLFIANRYAERGRKLYTAQTREIGGGGTPLGDLDQLTYEGVPWLGEWRINA